MKINEVDSVWFAGMAGSHMPIAVSHGEGQVKFKSVEQFAGLKHKASLPHNILTTTVAPLNYIQPIRMVLRRALLQLQILMGELLL